MNTIAQDADMKNNNGGNANAGANGGNANAGAAGGAGVGGATGGGKGGLTMSLAEHAPLCKAKSPETCKYVKAEAAKLAQDPANKGKSHEELVKMAIGEHEAAKGDNPAVAKLTDEQMKTAVSNFIKVNPDIKSLIAEAVELAKQAPDEKKEEVNKVLETVLNEAKKQSGAGGEQGNGNANGGAQGGNGQEGDNGGDNGGDGGAQGGNGEQSQGSAYEDLARRFNSPKLAEELENEKKYIQSKIETYEKHAKENNVPYYKQQDDLRKMWAEHTERMIDINNRINEENAAAKTEKQDGEEGANGEGANADAGNENGGTDNKNADGNGGNANSDNGNGGSDNGGASSENGNGEGGTSENGNGTASENGNGEGATSENGNADGNGGGASTESNADGGASTGGAENGNGEPTHTGTEANNGNGNGSSAEVPPEGNVGVKVDPKTGVKTIDISHLGFFRACVRSIVEGWRGNKVEWNPEAYKERIAKEKNMPKEEVKTPTEKAKGISLFESFSVQPENLNESQRKDLEQMQEDFANATTPRDRNRARSAFARALKEYGVNSVKQAANANKGESTEGSGNQKDDDIGFNADYDNGNGGATSTEGAATTTAGASATEGEGQGATKGANGATAQNGASGENGGAGTGGSEEGKGDGNADKGDWKPEHQPKDDPVSEGTSPQDHAKVCKANPKSNCPFLKAHMSAEELSQLDNGGAQDSTEGKGGATETNTNGGGANANGGTEGGTTGTTEGNGAEKTEGANADNGGATATNTNGGTSTETNANKADEIGNATSGEENNDGDNDNTDGEDNANGEETNAQTQSDDDGSDDAGFTVPDENNPTDLLSDDELERRTGSTENVGIYFDLDSQQSEEGEYQPKDDEDKEYFTTISNVLKANGIDAKVVSSMKGPTLVTYGIKIPMNVNPKTIERLADNFNSQMFDKDDKHVTFVKSGKGMLGIQFPHNSPEKVLMSEAFDSPEYAQAVAKSKNGIVIPLCKDETGKWRFTDLTKGPHMMVTGASGKGKSVFLNSLAASIRKAYNGKVKLGVIDPKGTEMAMLDNAGAGALVSKNLHGAQDTAKMVKLVESLAVEMKRRNDMIREASKISTANGGNEVHNIAEYNNLPDNIKRLIPNYKKAMPIVQIIDEVAQLRDNAEMLDRESGAKGKNGNLERLDSAMRQLSQLSRASGIHCIFTTQTPNVKAIPTTVQKNCGQRVTFRMDGVKFAGSPKSDDLVGPGDMRFSDDRGNTIRGQGAFIDGDELKDAVMTSSTEGLKPKVKAPQATVAKKPAPAKPTQTAAKPTQQAATNGGTGGTGAASPANKPAATSTATAKAQPTGGAQEIQADTQKPDDDNQADTSSASGTSSSGGNSQASSTATAAKPTTRHNTTHPKFQGPKSQAARDAFSARSKAAFGISNAKKALREKLNGKEPTQKQLASDPTYQSAVNAYAEASKNFNTVAFGVEEAKFTPTAEESAACIAAGKNEPAQPKQAATAQTTSGNANAAQATASAAPQAKKPKNGVQQGYYGVWFDASGRAIPNRKSPNFRGVKHEETQAADTKRKNALKKLNDMVRGLPDAKKKAVKKSDEYQKQYAKWKKLDHKYFQFAFGADEALPESAEGIVPTATPDAVAAALKDTSVSAELIKSDNGEAKKDDADKGKPKKLSALDMVHAALVKAGRIKE